MKITIGTGLAFFLTHSSRFMNHTAAVSHKPIKLQPWKDNNIIFCASKTVFVWGKKDICEEKKNMLLTLWGFCVNIHSNERKINKLHVPSDAANNF